MIFEISRSNSYRKLTNFACPIRSPKKQLWDILERRESFTWRFAQELSNTSRYNQLCRSLWTSRFLFLALRVTPASFDSLRQAKAQPIITLRIFCASGEIFLRHTDPTFGCQLWSDPYPLPIENNGRAS